MKWTKEEEDYLRQNYSTLIPLEEISKKLNRTIKSLKRKADELSLTRPRKGLDTTKKAERLKRGNRNYYLKHKDEMYQKKKQRIRKKKEDFVNLMGGKCSKCGYDKCIAALEFHHNQGNKEGAVTRIIKDYGKQKALKEVDKCILLCANCHRELHNLGA